MKLRQVWLLGIVPWVIILGSLPIFGATWAPRPVIAVGSGHSLALKTDGSLWACGANDSGQLGLGDTEGRQTFTPVGTGFVAAAAGSNYSLALKADGSLWSWGANGMGQLGLGSSDDNPHPTPALVGTGYMSMAAGGDHSLALKADGSLWVWGSNGEGQLGIGQKDTNPHPTPTQANNGMGFVAVAAGSGWASLPYSLGLKTDGGLWGWGNNINGQLGMGSNQYWYYLSPLPALGQYVAIAVGGYRSLGLNADGSLFVWGGGPFDPGNPTQLGTGYRFIANGDGHSLGIQTDGSLWTWGVNGHGQLGLGDTNDRTAPARVGTNRNWVALARGIGASSLGLQADGTLWAWGRNNSGQLGLGDTTERHVPTQVAGSQWGSPKPGNAATNLLLLSD